MCLQMIDTKKITTSLYDAAEIYTKDFYELKHREHLGISIIGEECSRKIWYGFRWCKLEDFSARMRRLFARGHSEEDKFIKLLFGIGFKIFQHDPKTGKQYKLSGCNGHYGGSGDSVGIIPEFPDELILLEFKTHNKKSFAKFGENKEISVKIAHPKHFAQMSGYGRGFGTKYGLYCAVNKDDDDLYFELLELDWNYGQQLESKAYDIITSKLPPPRISDNPAYHHCKYCTFSSICHDNAPVEKNCRSCQFSEPIENAKWRCNRFNDTIPAEYIKTGCEYHTSINQM